MREREAVRVERHRIDSVRVVEAGSVAPVIYPIPMPAVRPEGPNFVRSMTGSVLAQWLAGADPGAGSASTWRSAADTARDVWGRYRAGLISTGFDKNDRVVGWRAAFWWALVSRDAAGARMLAEYPVERLRGFDDGSLFDGFQYEWVEVLQAAWLHGPEAAGARAAGIRTESRVGAQRAVDLLIRPSIEVFVRLAEGDQIGFGVDLAVALVRHREFFDDDTWRGDPEGVFSLPLLGLACWAHDLGFDIEVESDYLPSGLLRRPDWAQSAEVAAERRRTDSEAVAPGLYQRIGAVLAASAPADRTMAWLSATRSGESLSLAPQYLAEDGERWPFAPEPDAMRELVTSLSRLRSDTEGGGEIWPQTWTLVLDADGNMELLRGLPSGTPIGALGTRFVPRHSARKPDHVPTAAPRAGTSGDGSSQFPVTSAELHEMIESAYARAAFATFEDAHGRTDDLRDEIDTIADAATARLQACLVPVGDHPISALVDGELRLVEPTAGSGANPSLADFLDALWPAMITRNHRLTDFLLGTHGRTGFPLAEVYDAATPCDDMRYYWAQCWQSVWTETHAARGDIEAVLSAADARADEYAAQIVAPALRILHASMFSYQDEPHLDNAVVAALRKHRAYWSAHAPEDPRGSIAWPILAAVCYATDRYRIPAAASGYLPAALIPADWTELSRKDIVQRPRVSHDADGDRLFPIRLGPDGRWQVVRFAI